MKIVSANELNENLNVYLEQAQAEQIIVELDNGARLQLSTYDTKPQKKGGISGMIAERPAPYHVSTPTHLFPFEQTVLDDLMEKLDSHDAPTRHQAFYNLIQMGETGTQSLVQHHDKLYAMLEDEQKEEPVMGIDNSATQETSKTAKRKLTANELRHSGLIGLWKDHDNGGFEDSTAYARYLREQAWKR